MKELGCRDLGGNCRFVARGKSSEEVKEILLDHADAEHADMMNEMSPEEKRAMMSKIDRLLKERPAASKSAARR